MKSRSTVIGLFLLAFSYSYSQTVNDISKVMLGVRFLDNASQETLVMKQQLENKLVMFATQSGYSSFGDNNFFISPNVIINSIDVAEGGMKNVYVVQGELFLTIQDDEDGTVYSSNSFSFKGSATKKETAIKNAVLNINYSKVQSLFDGAKEKILSYYEKQRDVIFARAEICANNGSYDEAITCLMMIPEELTDIYLQAIEKAQKIYDMRARAIQQQKIKERCDSNETVLTEANSLLAMHKPQEALKTLWAYHSGNENQNAQYTELMKKAEDLISASELEALRKEERAYQDNKQQQERKWDEYTKETAHKRNMDNRNMDLKEQLIESAERGAHNQISKEKQAIAASEKVAYYKANVDAQKVEDLKTVACEYIRNNPNRYYINVKY